MKIDLSNKNLRKIEPLNHYTETESNKIEIAVFDNNFINKLEHLESYSHLKQLSLANNSLVEIRGIVKLQNLQYLNLINNSLIHVDGLKDLKLLIWLNISGNEIKSLSPLKNNQYLKHIDASDNSIADFCDLTALNELQTFNLNGNLITSLKTVQNNLPKNLKHLFIANNAIEDLNEICFLSCLNQLEALEFQNNPCMEHQYNNEIIIDYRPFVLNWCITLNYLDGEIVSKKENLKAEWLYSQGKGRYFRPGQHSLLLEYLSKTCCLNSNESQFDDEVRLSKVLEKQQQHYLPTLQNNHPKNYRDCLSPSSNISQENNRQLTSNASINDQIQNLKSVLNNNTSFEDSDVELLNSETDYYLASNSATNTQTNTVMKDKFDFNFNSDVYLSQHLSRASSNPYEDYDKRPIKPLTDNVFKKQLDDYHEPNEEELNRIRKKQAHTRSKTVDSARVNNQKLTVKAIKQQKNQHIESNRPNTINNIKKRSKTTIEPKQINFNNKQNALKTASTASIYNPDNYSPRPNEKTNKVLQNNLINKKPNKNLFTLKTNVKRQQQQPPQQKIIQTKQQQHVVDSDSKNKHVNDEQLKTSTLSSFNDRCAIKIQSAWRGYYVRNCSSEVRKKFELLKYKRSLDYLKYLKENLNDLVDEHKQFCELNFQGLNTLWTLLRSIKSNENTQMKSPVTILNKDVEDNNSKLLLKENQELKDKIRYLEDQCKHFEKKLMEVSMKQTATGSVNYSSSQIESNSRLTLLAVTNTQTTQTSFDENNKFLTTNNTTDTTTDHTTLSNYDTTSTTNGDKSPSMRIEQKILENVSTILNPPLRVRLQKVNEKSVALKWDHNQSNVNNKIGGYRIYINSVLRGTVKPTDMKALINGIQEEGEYKITVRTFDENFIESNDSNTVITRVKKLNKSQQQDSSLNKSDVSEQQQPINSNKASVYPVEERKSSPLPQQKEAIMPKIMDKIRANSPNNTVPSTILPGSVSTQLLSTSPNDRQFSSPKKDKNLHYTLLKERLLEKQHHNRQPNDEDYHELLSKQNSFTPLYSHLNVLDDKSRSASRSPEELNHENVQLPFSNSTNFIQNRKTTIPTSQAISIVTNNKNQKDSVKYLGSPKEFNSLIDYKPPISPSTPPRIPSPTQFSPLISPVKINNFVSHSPTSQLASSKTSVTSYGFDVNNLSQNKYSTMSILPSGQNFVSKHKQSKSVDLSFDLNKIVKETIDANTDKNEEDSNSNNMTNNNDTNSLISNNSLTTTNNTTNLLTKDKVQKNFMIKSAKFSISEPNLSASIAKSDTSGGGGGTSTGMAMMNGNTNSNTKLDLVRQSLSFDEDEDEDDYRNNLVKSNNKENEKNLINVNRAQRIFRIRNKLLDDNNLISKANSQKTNKNIIETS